MKNSREDKFLEELKHENKMLREQKEKLLYLIRQEKAERIYLENLIEKLQKKKAGTEIFYDCEQSHSGNKKQI
jgi:hypothetical protein